MQVSLAVVATVVVVVPLSSQVWSSSKCWQFELVYLRALHSHSEQKMSFSIANNIKLSIFSIHIKLSLMYDVRTVGWNQLKGCSVSGHPFCGSNLLWYGHCVDTLDFFATSAYCVFYSNNIIEECRKSSTPSTVAASSRPRPRGKVISIEFPLGALTTLPDAQ